MTVLLIVTVSEGGVVLPPPPPDDPMLPPPQPTASANPKRTAAFRTLRPNRTEPPQKRLQIIWHSHESKVWIGSSSQTLLHVNQIPSQRQPEQCSQNRHQIHHESRRLKLPLIQLRPRFST